MGDYDGYDDINEKALEAQAILRGQHGKREFRHADLSDKINSDYEKMKKVNNEKRVRKAREQCAKFKATLRELK